MEVRRTKNAATYIVFPIVDADGDFVTGAAGLDSEIDSWSDGSAPDGFADCTNEATEIGTTGMYYLSLTATEMNADYIAVQVKTSTSGAKTQMILINTTLQRADVIGISGDTAAADALETYCDGTTPQPVDVTTWKGSTAPAMTGDAYARLGAPAGASVSADIAAAKTAIDAVDDYVDTEVASVKAVTDKLDTALELDVDVYRFTTNALEMSPAGEGGGATAEAIRIEMDSNSTRLASIDGKLASTTVTVQSPVASSGAITVHTGDDYDATHGRAIEVTVDDVPSLSGATVKLKCAEATWTGTASAGAGTAWVLRFEPTAAETAVLTKRTQAYEIEAVLSDGDVVTLGTGTLSTVRDIPEVV